MATKNLKQKLQEARMLLKERKIKPSGYNDFTKSAYFSLGDILPSITEVCNEVGICPLFSYANEATTLTLASDDNPRWVNDIAVAKVIKHLKTKLEQYETK